MGIATIDKLNKIDADNIYNKLKEIEKKEMPIVFKNRIHLCSYLEIQPGKCGNQRISEDRFMSSIFNSYKDKHKIIITEIYDDYKDRLLNTTIRYKELLDFALKYNTNSMGVYGVYVDNELVYIGSSSKMYDRIRTHCQEMYAEENYNDSKYIKLHKYLTEGKNITFKVIDDNITEENRYEIEYKYIEQYKPILNTVGITKNTPYITSLSPEVKKSNYNKRNLKNIKLIKQYKEQINKYQNKISLLQEKIDILEKELLN